MFCAEPVSDGECESHFFAIDDVGCEVLGCDVFEGLFKCVVGAE